MPQLRPILSALCLAATLVACHTPPKSGSTAEVDEVVDGKGYFVTLASKPTAPEAQKVYDKLYDALDSYNRKRAHAAEGLDAYVEEFQETGFTSLKGGDDEIECDRDKCLLKLHARRVGGERASAERPSFPQQLFEALLGAGVAAKAGTRGEDFLKTVTLGEQEHVQVACTERRTAAGQLVDYGCVFDLDGLKGDSVAKSETLERGERGKLSSCVMSPGIVKAAEEAKGDVEGGGLVTLTAGASDSTKPVGYLRYSRQDRRVELVDLFLCGDLSQDTFYLAGEGKDPRKWVAGIQRSSPGATGAGSVDIPPAHHDDGDLTLRASVAAQTSKDVTLEVHFKVVKDPAAALPEDSPIRADEVYGEDKFFVKLDKKWLK